MAKKNNIRSIRFSDEMIELIESQAGETFTAKFEALVTRCMWELPKKEQELKFIQELIDSERKSLRYIQDRKRKLEQNLYLVENRTAYFVQQVNLAITELEKT